LELAKAALDAKIAASKGKYSEADITTKGSSLRKTDAYKGYKEASDKYTAAKNISNQETNKKNNMVTIAD
jgi:hypothetical protein